MGSKLIEIVRNPTEISRISEPDISGLLGEIEILRARLWSRLAEPRSRDPESRSSGEDRLLPIVEAAERLAFRPAYLYELIRKGDFPAIRQGKYVRIRHKDLEEWIRRRARENA
jgi:excisionase family DNA binding protein